MAHAFRLVTFSRDPGSNLGSCQLYIQKGGEPRKRRVLREIEPQGNGLLAADAEIVTLDALLALTCETCRSLDVEGLPMLPR